LTDQPAVDKAASFFSGLDEMRYSNTTGAWAPKVRFTFTRPSGEKVTVVSEYVHWNDTKGADFPVQGDLETYVKTLFGKSDSP
jgi:hypothetical protein